MGSSMPILSTNHCSPDEWAVLIGQTLAMRHLLELQAAGLIHSSHCMKRDWERSQAPPKEMGVPSYKKGKWVLSMQNYQL